jgi:hypothetical protein
MLRIAEEEAKVLKEIAEEEGKVERIRIAEEKGKVEMNQRRDCKVEIGKVHKKERLIISYEESKVERFSGELKGEG